MPREYKNRILKVFIPLCSLFLATIPSALGQVSASTNTQIPAGVRYKTASDEANASARAALEQSLKPESAVAKTFFGSAVTCGPTLWKVLKPSAEKNLLDSKLVVAVVNSIQVEARGLITDEQKQSFWKLLLNKYPDLQRANIRKADAEEINYYWATIPFDITEPLFTVDTGTTKLIVNFGIEDGKPKLFWIDQVGDLKKLTSGFGEVVDLTALTMMAEDGAVPSMLQLAKGYWSGKSIPMDIIKARYWFDRASEKGSLDAQMFLGMCYFAGKGFPKDHKVASQYLQLAAKQGNPLAQYYIGMMYHRGDGLDQSDEEAVKYLQLAVNQNSGPAEYDLGVFYNSGIGVPVDKKSACTLYEKASEQGHLMAMNNLGHCYESGEGIEKNPQKAMELFTKSANSGIVLAQENLSSFYGRSGDWENSYFWARIAQIAGTTPNHPAIAEIETHLTQAQIDSAEAAIIEWQKAHPAKNQVR